MENKATAQKAAAKNLSQKVEPQKEIEQMSLFGSYVDPKIETLMNKLDATDVNRLTPIEALMLVNELKKVLGN